MRENGIWQRTLRAPESFEQLAKKLKETDAGLNTFTISCERCGTGFKSRSMNARFCSSCKPKRRKEIAVCRPISD